MIISRVQLERQSPQYVELGKKVKQDILSLIKKEGIEIRESYEASFLGNATYSVIRDESTKKETHEITVPKLTDASDMRQSIVLAHELGHYYVEKRSKKWVKELMPVGWRTLREEKLAWKEANRILKSVIGLPENAEELSLQNAAYQEFEDLSEHALATYRQTYGFWTQLKTIFKIPLKIVGLLIKSYLLIAFIVLLETNGIPVPIPFSNGFASYPLSDADFYKAVLMVFNLVIMSKLAWWTFRRMT